MTLEEALRTNKKVTRNSDGWIQYFEGKTGPFSYLVDCSYFVIHEDNVNEYFTTSLDLYPEDIFASDWRLFDVCA